MLPDYPELKRKIREKLMDLMQQQILAASGIVGEIPRSVMFEGDKFVIVREDGSIQEAILSEIAASMTFSKEELSKASPADVVEKIGLTAIEMATQQSKMTFDFIDEEVDKVGNKIDTKGKKPIDAYLEGLEKILIDFDQKTQMPKLPRIVTSPDAAVAFAKDLEKLQVDPVYRNRYEEILERKKEEWIVRESNRKLVG